MQGKKKDLSARSASVLMVGASSPAMERKMHRLHAEGFVVTQAETICHAELFSEAQYFDAAVYDESLAEVEQLSLARIMRMRWPWMRLIRCGNSALAASALFDASSASEANLPATIQGCL